MACPTIVGEGRGREAGGVPAPVEFTVYFQGRAFPTVSYLGTRNREINPLKSTVS